MLNRQFPPAGKGGQFLRTISVFGLGYVGAVTASCLAKAGHRVIGVDVNPIKVEMLESGHAPVLEPSLNELIAEGRRASRLARNMDLKMAVSQSEISFLCVGTPSLHNGSLDVSAVKRSCEEIGKALRSKKEFHWIVLRSTVLPGTARSLAIPTIEAASGSAQMWILPYVSIQNSCAKGAVSPIS